MADDREGSTTMFGVDAWDGDSQPSEDADAGGTAAESTQSEDIPSASESLTTESSSITKALDSASINANGPGGEHHGKGLRRGQLADEIERLSKEKLNHVMKDKEPDHWKREIQLRMEREIDQRVRDALETPPLERMQRNKQKAKMRKFQQEKYEEKQNRSLSIDDCNSYAQTLPSLRNQQPWNKVDSSFCYYETDQSEPGIGPHDRDSISRSAVAGTKQQRTPGAWGDRTIWKQSTTTTEINRSYIQGQTKSEDEFEELNRISEIRRKTFHRYTAEGFKELLKQGKLKLKKLGNGRFMDKNGVVMTVDGPFWPPECGPLYGKPEHVYQQNPGKEPLSDAVPHDGRTVHTQRTNKWYRPWEQIQVVYDSERTTKGTVPHPVPEGCSTSLLFESRFESGNLRQARRIGQFEYDLVLKTDLYTNRHTQWYYFRIQRMIPGVTYKFNIVNLLKKDSLYNHGMRPLLYSEKEAEASSAGWMRAGHHISYNRSYGFNRNSLLHPEMSYYVLEWQMEFCHENDTCFFAHCYPYTFTDLRDHLETLMSEPERRRCIRREVLCETKAGNSCFLLTVTNFSEKSNDDEKKVVVVSARVHPGETNASWMMKGLLDFITSSDPIAKQLRELFIFKIIPMLNPDGVIVGNYRCSLSARDLNRNYRHPKKESFPTVWHLKNLLQELLDNDREVVVYCDLHGHSRKHNVFIYGCDPQSKEGDAASFLYQRLFPWLMSRMAPDKFSFPGCKFRVKRCKESTGRVVMWRQMNIANSFTMEATFCGAKNIESIDMPRHFNASDFQDLGRHFCEALLEYHKAQLNKSLHSELILELTQQITHQVLQSRGLLPLDYNDSGKGKTDSLGKDGHTQSKPSSSKDKNSGTSTHEGVRKIQSRLEALKMIDALSSETIKGCIHILQDLKILREFVESDTSDSDSASESEQPNNEPDEEMKTKKRKKKRSKHKSRGVILPELTLPEAEELNTDKKKAVDSKQHMKLVLQSQGVGQATTTGDQPRSQLPLELRFHNPISHLNPDLRPFRMACHAKSHRIFDERALKADDGPTMYRLLEPQVMNFDETNQFKMDMNQDTTSAYSGKFTHMKKYPPFVNRYMNRSNGGIPMFSQERITERNLKRLSTIQTIQKQGQDSESEFKESDEYARLLAITKHIQEQEDAVRYKMNASPTGGQPNAPYKHPFTHSNSFHGLQQSSQSPRHLEPMDPMNTGNHVHKLQRSKTMIQPSRQLGHLKHPSDQRGFLDNHYHGNELGNPMTDGNNNNLQSTDALLTDELSRTFQMHCGSESEPVFEQRNPLQLNMKQQRSSNITKLGRPSLSAALPTNPSYNSTNPSYKSSAYKGSLRHKTAPVGKMTGSTVNRGHAADLISQQYGHFLSQTPKVPPSAAARYLESLTKSLSKNPSSSSPPRPMLTLTKTTSDKDLTEVKMLEDLQVKTVL